MRQKRYLKILENLCFKEGLCDMKFNELDSKMRVYETDKDYYIPKDFYVVVRLDGRSFTTLTKNTYNFKKPFDVQFRDMMVETTKHLMNCGFNIVYAYTESDEISLVLSKDDNTFNRKARKLLSVLAGEASAKFTHLLGGIGCFDARISELTSEEVLVDYFQWRREDSHRNALNSLCYWTLREKCHLSAAAAASKLKNLDNIGKVDLLKQEGEDFSTIPSWQKYGTGLYFEEYTMKGFNPVTGAESDAIRARIVIDYDLPKKEDYKEYVLSKLRGRRLVEE